VNRAPVTFRANRRPTAAPATFHANRELLSDHQCSEHIDVNLIKVFKAILLDERTRTSNWCFGFHDGLLSESDDWVFGVFS